MPESSNSRNVTSILTKKGTVVSNKMDKTIVVRIDGVVRHRMYKKPIRRSVKVKVHDEKNTAKIGDVVSIRQTRPLSKDKRWKLERVLETAK